MFDLRRATGRLELFADRTASRDLLKILEAAGLRFRQIRSRFKLGRAIIASPGCVLLFGRLKRNFMVELARFKVYFLLVRKWDDGSIAEDSRALISRLEPRRLPWGGLVSLGVETGTNLSADQRERLIEIYQQRAEKLREFHVGKESSEIKRSLQRQAAWCDDYIDRLKSGGSILSYDELWDGKPTPSTVKVATE